MNVFSLSLCYCKGSPQPFLTLGLNAQILDLFAHFSYCHLTYLRIISLKQSDNQISI